MSYIIDLKYYNVEVGNRLVILDSVDKTIFKKITMKKMIIMRLAILT